MFRCYHVFIKRKKTFLSPNVFIIELLDRLPNFIDSVSICLQSYHTLIVLTCLVCFGINGHQYLSVINRKKPHFIILDSPLTAHHSFILSSFYYICLLKKL